MAQGAGQGTAVRSGSRLQVAQDLQEAGWLTATMSIWDVYKRALVDARRRAHARPSGSCWPASRSASCRSPSGVLLGARGECPGARAGRLSHHRLVGAGRPGRHPGRRRRGGDGRPAGAPAPSRRARPGLRARHHPAHQLSRREGLGRGGAHHPGRHRRAVLELAVVPARAVRGAGRHPRAGADRHLHEPDDGADPGGARRHLRARQRAGGAEDQHRTGGRRAVPQQRLRPRRRRARQRHGGAELCALQLRDAGHALDHGRAADRAVSGTHLVGAADRADAHGRHRRLRRHLRRRRRAGRARPDHGRRDRDVRRLRRHR